MDSTKARPSPFRVIVVVDGERTIQMVVRLERAPLPGEKIDVPGVEGVTVRHVLAARRGGIAGVILAWSS